MQTPASPMTRYLEAIVINAYGIDAALIDAALEARRRGVRTIGVTPVRHATATTADHPARHPSGRNRHDLVDLVVDSQVEVGDVVVTIEGFDQPVAAMSTFANAYVLNAIVAETVELLVRQGVRPLLWMSGNACGGDEANARVVARFEGRI